MNERYERLFSLPDNLYLEGSPVVIAAGALLKDKNTEKILAQLKFRNIGQKPITAVSVKITSFDTAGKSIGEPFSYSYLDLSAARDAEFGQKQAIPLPHKLARGFRVVVTEAIFSDNEIWTAEGEDWESLKRPEPLEFLLKDAELVKQYQIKFGKDCVYSPQEVKDLWYCSCGALNRKAEKTCHICRRALEALSNPDRKELAQEKEKRLQEQQKQEIEKRKETKKRMKIGAGVLLAAAIVAAAAFTVQVLVPDQRYKKAEKLFAEKDYIGAKELFSALGDYQDAEEKVRELSGLIADQETYEKAEAKLQKGDYGAAAELFASIPDYEDAKTRSSNAENQRVYAAAEALFEAGSYAEAAEAFGALGTYSDSAERAAESSYHAAEKLLENGDKAHAAITFGSVADYKDARERSLRLWDEIVRRDTLICGYDWIAAVKEDGTVLFTGEADWQQEISGWTDLVALTATYMGSSSPISATKAECLIGLRADGTVLSAGINAEAQADAAEWTDIVDVAVNDAAVIGLKLDGTVITTEMTSDFQPNWYTSNVVAVSERLDVTADGKVGAWSNSQRGAEKIIETPNAVDADSYSSAGMALYANGTVEAYGNANKSETKDWTDIIAIDVSDTRTVGLRSNGTVVSVNSYIEGAKWDFHADEWTDIVAVACSNNQIVGLRPDGSAIAKGINDPAKCSVEGWSGIRMPNRQK